MSAPGTQALAWLSLLGAGCGLTTVELAPLAPETTVVQGDVPASVLRRFSAQATGKEDPAQLRLLYPDAALPQVPQELAPLPFAWAAGPMPAMPKGPAAAAMDASYFELCLRSARRSFCLYTTATQGSAPPELWSRLAQDSVAQPLDVSLRALRGDALYVAETQVSFADVALSGSVYAQTHSDPALRRSEWSDGSEDAPEPLDATKLDAKSRGAVYALARDGRRLVVAASEQELSMLQLPEQRALWTVKPGLPGRGPVSLALDPTARAVACARGGSLVLLDADTGAELSSGVLPAGVRVGQPDWSPDARFLAVALWPEGAEADEQALQGSSLARLPVALDGTLGAPEVLLASDAPDDTLVFPAYSSDGKWIAFERLKGKLRDGKEARVWLLPAAGGRATSLAMGAAGLGPAEQATQHQPSWLEVRGASWLAFASTRPVGARKQSKDQRQLWLAPLDLSAASAGADPSAPAVWLAFQPEKQSAERATFLLLED